MRLDRRVARLEAVAQDHEVDPVWDGRVETLGEYMQCLEKGCHGAAAHLLRETLTRSASKTTEVPNRDDADR
jgi:hypothetical protein